MRRRRGGSKEREKEEEQVQVGMLIRKERLEFDLQCERRLFLDFRK